MVLVKGYDISERKTSSEMSVDAAREKSLSDYRKKLMEHKEVEAKLKDLRLQLRDLNNQYEKSENDLKALQSVGQIVGEVLRQLTEEKFIVKVRKCFKFFEILNFLFRQLTGPGMWSVAEDNWRSPS